MYIYVHSRDFLIGEIPRSEITVSLHLQIFKGFSYSLPTCLLQMPDQFKLPPAVNERAGFPTEQMHII